jgi:squalene synthase HpnC
MPYSGGFRNHRRKTALTRNAIIDRPIDECTVGGAKRPENFPVASLLLGRSERAVARAFYRFARFADDIADSPLLMPETKLAALDALDAALQGREASSSTAVDVSAACDLRRRLAARGLEPGHARALLGAFRRDAENRGTADWDELMAYCRASAAPVGRFLLDLHGEARRAVPAADALCAALQVLNHVQDVGEDARLRGRIYIPLDGPEGVHAEAADLAAAKSSPALRACLDRALDRTARLIDEAEALPAQVQSPGLRAEAAAIVFLARTLLARLRAGDPLAGRIRPTPADFVRAAAVGLRALVAPPKPGLLRGEAARTVAETVAQSGSSFRLGLSCLPRERRQAMQALYAFCRALDDIADDTGRTPQDRRAALSAWEDWLTRLEANETPDGAPPLVAALAAVRDRFGFDFAEGRALVAGMRMDVDGPIVAPDAETFALYCRRVAGGVGLLSLPLLGAHDAASRRFALALGEALQCVNILRDVAEDAAIGRCYLPRDLLSAHGIDAADAARIAAHPALGAVRADLARRARAQFAAARKALTPGNARALFPARAMMAAYEDLLRRLERRGWSELVPPPRPGRLARLACLLRLPRPRRG